MLPLLLLWLTSLLLCCAVQGRVSGMLASVPVFAVLAEDVGQRGAYRVAYQQGLQLLSAPAGGSGSGSGGEDKAAAKREEEAAAGQKRNKLLLVTGLLISLFVLGAKSRHCAMK